MTSLPSDMSKIWEALQPASPSENPSIITHVPVQVRLNAIDILPDELFNNEPWYITSDSIRDTLPDSITPVTTNTSSTITPPIATINTVDINPNFDIEQYINSIKDRFADINTHIESDEHRYDDNDYGIIIEKIQHIASAVNALQLLIEDNNQ